MQYHSQLINVACMYIEKLRDQGAWGQMESTIYLVFL
jgi:hypothetical protein